MTLPSCITKDPTNKNITPGKVAYVGTFKLDGHHHTWNHVANATTSDDVITQWFVNKVNATYPAAKVDASTVCKYASADPKQPDSYMLYIFGGVVIVGGIIWWVRR